MSYQQSYRTTISGVANGSVSVSVGDKSVSRSVSIPWEEEIITFIDVDTAPVDSAVSACRGNIDRLDSSIVVGAQLQAAHKDAGAETVVKSATRGFNRLVFSEMDQQLKEIASALASRSALLIAEKGAADNKERQFAADFERIKSRYATLFDGLNQELDRRIRDLDGAIFQLVRNDFQENIQTGLNIGPSGALMGMTEELAVESALTVGRAKRLVQDLIARAVSFIAGQQSLRKAFCEILLPKTVEVAVPLSLPVVISTIGLADESTDSSSITSGLSEIGLTGLDSRTKERASNLVWCAMDEQAREGIGRHLAAMIQEKARAGDEQEARQAEYILTWWEASKPETLEH